MWRTIGWVLAASCLAIDSSNAADEPGLLGRWKFDDAQGDVVVDSSGQGNDGEVWDADWVRGEFGTALAFDGSGAHVRVPEIAGLDGSDEMTVEAWVLWEGTGRYPNIISGGTWSPGGFLFFVQDGNCSFRMGRPGHSATQNRQEWREVGVNMLTPFEEGKWYHLAATFERPEITTYVNGKQVGSGKWDYPVGYEGDLVIGKWSGAVSHKGLIDDVSLYGRALSAEEIAKRFQEDSATRGPTPNGVPLYQEIPRTSQLAAAVATFEMEFATLAIGPSGRCTALIDKRTGEDRILRTTPLVTIKQDGTFDRRASCSLEKGKLVFRFARSGVTVVLDVVMAAISPAAGTNSEAASRAIREVNESSWAGQYLVFRIASVEGMEPDEVTFVQLDLKPCEHVHPMSGLAGDDDFGVCLRTLNLRTQVVVRGGSPSMTARAYKEYGLGGAAAALVACPTSQLRPVLQSVLRKEGVPYSELGGPFALDAPANRGSYVFATVSEKNVDQWIELARRGGIDCIHMNGWATSLGHYEPRKELFPNGLEGLKEVVRKIHEAGLKAGMHTLTGCIAPHDPFIRPVPDPRLATDGTFTLTGDLDEKVVDIPTVESPGNYPTIWAYSSRGNCIRIDDELIQYSVISNEPGYGFFKCKRGAFGTKPAAHKKGAPVHHMLVRYGCFQPDEKSGLVDDVADRIANVYNTCEMDQIYMDGAEAMRGWYGIARMRNAIYSRLKGPALVEASCWDHHSWAFHSRVGAWDHPKWGLKRFADDHFDAVRTYRRACLLEAQLGWWVILGPGRDWDMERPDEIEYLCSKALGHDAPLSFQSVSVTGTPANARQDEYFAMIGNYERLRLANYFSEAVKEKVREERQEFRLEHGEDGAWQLIPTDYLQHKVTGLDDGTSTWTAANKYEAQPLRLRIQALYSAYPYDDEKSQVLAAFTDSDEFTPAGTASRVSLATQLGDQPRQLGEACQTFTATNESDSPVGAWARATKKFDPVADLTPYDAIGFWVRGDGSGALLNLQFTNLPEYFRTLDDHHVRLDFEGWRYVELLLRERDAAGYHDYKWPYGAHCVLHRSSLVRHAVSQMTVYLNNLPPGEEVRCTLGPIKALRTRKVVLHNPAVEIGGKRLIFPVDLESGMTIEFESMDDCRLYDERGNLLQRLQPEGDVPTLTPDENRVRLDFDGPDGFQSRAEVTVITGGTPLRERMPDGQIDWPLLNREYEPARQISALDGVQNRWEVFCPPQMKSADVHFEMTVAQVGSELAAYEAESAVPCASFEAATETRDPKYAYNEQMASSGCHKGVTQKLRRSSETVRFGKGSVCYTATSARDDNAGWSYKPGPLAKSIDLSDFKAIGFWLYGDGGGQSLKLQLRDAAGGWQDMYQQVDFTGWRYCHFALGGPKLKDPSRITAMHLYYNGIPAGKTVTCYVDEIRVLRDVEPLTNPELTIADKPIRFPIAMSAGDRLVFKGMDDCRLYRASGKIEQVAPVGALPRLHAGRNRVEFGLSGKVPDEFRVAVSLEKRYKP
jgi:concanavalin A-like lectin/glucanase superfamily protein